MPHIDVPYGRNAYIIVEMMEASKIGVSITDNSERLKDILLRMAFEAEALGEDNEELEDEDETPVTVFRLNGVDGVTIKRLQMSWR